MINLTLLREHPEKFAELVHKKDPDFEVNKLIDLDKSVRTSRLQVEELRHKKNELAQQGKQGITEQLREQSIIVGKQLKEKELVHQETEFKWLYLRCPNIPSEDVPAGGKEANTVVKQVGEQLQCNFPVKNHLDLAHQFGWIDFETAAKIAGSNFALYKGEAVRALYALAMFMLNNNIEYGFKPVIPPYLANEKSLVTTGNFPKFKEDVYAVRDEDLYLIPTAEVSIANMYRDMIVSQDELPIRHTAWTSCFRREAGGYGATERGLIRIHQFEKVELFTLCEPDNAYDEQEKMLECAENILKQLGLHYRVSLLAAQDSSFPSAKTYDIEVWLPGQKEYYEVSSVSNCTDFQARRGKIRYKNEKTGKNELVYTLNGSSLALPRLMVALMETYQQEDGSIALPHVLNKYGI